MRIQRGHVAAILADVALPFATAAAAAAAAALVVSGFLFGGAGVEVAAARVRPFPSAGCCRRWLRPLHDERSVGALAGFAWATEGVEVADVQRGFGFV